MLFQFVGFVLAKEVELEFKVVPNKAGEIEVALDTPPIPSSTCRFEWDSSGATVEVRATTLVKTMGCSHQKYPFHHDLPF